MIDATADLFSDRPPRRAVPVAVQIIGTMLFGAFAIVAVIFAFNAFWPAGVVLAIVLGWRGNFTSATPPQLSPEDLIERVQALRPGVQTKASGNSSFDAYRSDVLHRLEEEQAQFDGFLGRLREAKDQTEFDQFMDDRARRASTEQATDTA